MNTTPKVSIIIPVYNVEVYVRQCLESIEAQTYSDFEVILVDDGSTDNSGKICDEYAGKDSRFVVIHKLNEGVAKARLTGFEHSKGDYISFIDADDYVSPLYLEILSKPIIENNVDLVSCDLYIDKDGKIIKPTAKYTGVYDKKGIRQFLAEHYLYDKQKNYGMTVFLWSKMIKRHLVLNGLQTGLGLWFGEDQVGVFSMLLHCEKMALIPDRLYYYVERDGQASMRYDETLWDSMILMFQTYQNLDREGLVKNGLRKRTWKSMSYSITHKMLKNGISRKDFCKQINRLRQNPYIKKFFKPLTIGIGIKEEFYYWLLKLRLYSVYYKLIKRKIKS